MPALLLELFGLLMIVAGTTVMWRAIALVRPDLVARTLAVGLDPTTGSAHQGGRRPGSSKIGDVHRVKSFEEELAALNDQMGPRDK